ncbi:MAG: hypothetical protein R2856_17440 [Caldilineaceae bacterium]
MSEQGIRGVKIWPFDKYSERNLGQSIFSEEIERGLEPVRSIRNAVSNDFRIGIECHFRFNRAAWSRSATRWSRTTSTSSKRCCAPPTTRKSNA